MKPLHPSPACRIADGHFLYTAGSALGEGRAHAGGIHLRRNVPDGISVQPYIPHRGDNPLLRHFLPGQPIDGYFCFVPFAEQNMQAWQKNRKCGIII